MPANTITVAPGPKLEPGQVAIWERDPEHPANEEGQHEVYLAAPHVGEEAASIEVGRTAEVSKRLSDGRLVEVRASRRAASAPPAPELPSPTSPDAEPDPLAAPGLLTDAQRKALADAGVTTTDDVRRMSDDDLESVEGIGPATVARLRAAVE